MTRDEELAIEHECARLVARYANLNDAAEWEEAAALFAEDGRFNRPTAPDEWIEGRAAILESFLSRLLRTTRHLCANVVITVVDTDEARGDSAMALFLANDLVKVGAYLDRFVRTPAGWRFAERRGHLTF